MAIQSVLSQRFPDCEYLVVDGGPSDGTVGILRRCPHLTWISEPGRGQADALNKGLALASGDVVGWINADDYYDRDVFFDVAACFTDPQILWAVGNVAGWSTNDTQHPPLRAYQEQDSDIRCIGIAETASAKEPLS
jgi:glycosyltransferase involved in cell wall biosynthesis